MTWRWRIWPARGDAVRPPQERDHRYQRAGSAKHRRGIVQHGNSRDAGVGHIAARLRVRVAVLTVVLVMAGICFVAMGARRQWQDDVGIGAW